MHQSFRIALQVIQSKTICKWFNILRLFLTAIPCKFICLRIFLDNTLRIIRFKSGQTESSDYKRVCRWCTNGKVANVHCHILLVIQWQHSPETSMTWFKSFGFRRFMSRFHSLFRNDNHFSLFAFQRNWLDFLYTLPTMLFWTRRPNSSNFH